MRSPRRAITRCALLAACACGVPCDAAADDWQFGGHAKYQYSYSAFRADDLAALYGDDPANDHSVDLRLKAERRAGRWDVAAHYELLAASGDSVATRRALDVAGFPPRGPVTGLPDDRTRLFDLTDQVIDQERTVAVQRLDRLALGYTSARASLRFGRQAVSWGNGLVFQPLDFVNPFSPFVIDKDYKTGDDLLFGQWLPTVSSELQGIVVPRRDAMTQAVESAESTYAAKYRRRLETLGMELLAARHYDENLAGASAVRSLGGAVWRLDLSAVDSTTEGTVFSGVTNLDYSWTWWDKNFYGYLEYFRNGFGESVAANYVNPNPGLAARIARGELFTLARDYLAAGGQIEFTPLVNLFASAVRNLNDASHVLQLRGVYDWQQDLQLMAGVNLPFGDRGDEYGGVPAAPGAYAAAGRSAYARIAYYF
jgi:hypothetical protein